MPSLDSTGPGRPVKESKAPAPALDDEEDDYMSMSFSEPLSKAPETSIQRRARLRKEAEARSRPLSKAEKAAKDVAERDAALATSLDASNKGFQMMAKLGFKGGALGKNAEGRVEPIQPTLKEDRGGIGLDAEKKRKFRDEVEGMEKRVKAEEGDYRERVRREREVKRLEGQVIGAMKAAERLDGEAEDGDTKFADEKAEDGKDDAATDESTSAARKQPQRSKPLRSIPVVWRGVVQHRLVAERERRMRYDLHQSLSRLPDYTDPDEDADDKRAFGNEEEEVELEDPELEEFNALEPEVRLAKIVKYLRQMHWYCFWCKSKYDDAGLEGCPGLTEEDHD